MKNREFKLRAHRRNGEKNLISKFRISDEIMLHWHEDIRNDFIKEYKVLFKERSRKRFIQLNADPDTICEWTGLTDSEGNDIYEHDIIEIPNERGELVLGEVKWIGSGFEVGIDDNFFIGAPLYTFAPEVRARVVGNIYDNPDLLK